MKKNIIFVCTLISLLYSSSVNSQVDIKRTGYYEVIVADTVYSSHVQEYQAIEQMINLTPIVATIKAPTLVVDWTALEVAPDTITIVEEIPVYLTDTVTIVKEIPVYLTDTITIVQRDTVFSHNEQGIILNGLQYFSEDFKAIYPEEVIDTLEVTECFEDYNKKIWLYTVGDSDSGGDVWIPFKEIGLSKVTIDSMPIWKKKYQKKYKLERTKNHDVASTSYRELGMPFQFMNDSIVSIESDVVRVRVFANEDWYPMLYVEDQLWQDGSEFTPGYQDFDGFETRRHTITFNGLLPDTNYTLKVIGHSRLRKEETSILFSVKTLP